MTVEIRRGSARFVDRAPGRDTRHSFSFGEHYDPERVSFGPMICHDEHSLGGDRGFPDHQHRDAEIVTWVLDGVLEHSHTVASSDPVAGRLEPGSVQVLSAGAGVTHSEIAAPGIGITRFVQVWLTPDESSTPPAYAVSPVSLEPGWTVLASGRDPAAPARLGAASATFRVARLGAGETIALPDADRQHVFVARGALTRSSMAEPLSTGDAFLVTDHPSVGVTAAVPTELLLWTFDR